MDNKDTLELMELPIEVINPGNGLPDAPVCSPFSETLPCQGEFTNGSGSSNCPYIPSHPGCPQFYLL